MERFFKYSRDHAKPIRLLTVSDPAAGKLSCLTVIVVRWDDESLYYIRNSSKPQKAKQMDRSRILAAEYARGDDGGTLKFIEREEAGTDED